jgi:tetratricopeptide (TPR) repeat protein
MYTYRVAAPVSILLLALTAPSIGQTTEDAPKERFAKDLQTSSQVSTSNVSPGQHQLGPEEMADLMMARKQYREASEKYKELVDQDPRNAVYLNKLGISLHQQMALSQALKYYQKAVKADPQYADAENNIGALWYGRKKYSKAIRAYQKAIKMRDGMAVTYSNLGYAYFSDGKYQESIAAFRTALSLDPEFFERGGSRTGSVLQDRSVTDRGRFYFLLAKTFAQNGSYDRCIFYLRKAKEEGYASFSDIKKDPAFAAFLKKPEIMELLVPKSAESTQP